MNNKTKILIYLAFTAMLLLINYFLKIDSSNKIILFCSLGIVLDFFLTKILNKNYEKNKN